MADSAQRSITVHTPPEKLYAVVVDYERYPEFLSNIKKARVVERQERHVVVDFEASILGKSIPYTLAFDEDPPRGIRWRLVKSSFLKENNGSWVLKAEGEGKTLATYSLQVKVGFFIPGAVSTALAGSELPKVLEAFKKRAEES
jgi:coenzyme Q-binding protein COQ10